MEWTHLTSSDQIDEILNDSSSNIFLVFKHSTRCSISSMAKNRLEAKWDKSIPIKKAYYLDLIKYRPLSNSIANDFDVVHESPQILLIKNGMSFYNTSHNQISLSTIQSQLG